MIVNPIWTFTYITSSLAAQKPCPLHGQRCAVELFHHLQHHIAGHVVCFGTAREDHGSSHMLIIELADGSCIYGPLWTRKADWSTAAVRPSACHSLAKLNNHGSARLSLSVQRSKYEMQTLHVALPCTVYPQLQLFLGNRSAEQDVK